MNVQAKSQVILCSQLMCLYLTRWWPSVPVIHRGWIIQYVELSEIKNKYHRTAKWINTNDAWIRYRASRNKVTDLVRNSKTDYFKNLASSLNQGNLSSKQWWKVTKQFLKQNKDSDIPLLIQNGNHYSYPLDKANVLNNYFRYCSKCQHSPERVPSVWWHYQQKSLFRSAGIHKA